MHLCCLFLRVEYSFFLVSDSESASEENLDTYKEWTSRRPWKERKKANKAQKNGNSQLVLQSQDAELIFYGLHSGVVGLSKSKLYGSGLSHHGYDKVNCMLYIFFLLFFDTTARCA